MDAEGAKTARESLDLAFHMSNMLDTGHDRHTLSVLSAHSSSLLASHKDLVLGIFFISVFITLNFLAIYTHTHTYICIFFFLFSVFEEAF